MSNYPPGPGRGISEGSCSISFISLELRKAYKTMAVISLTTHSEGVLGAVVGLCILHLIMLVALYATRIPAMIRRKIDPQKGAVAKDSVLCSGSAVLCRQLQPSVRSTHSFLRHLGCCSHIWPRRSPACNLRKNVSRTSRLAFTRPCHEQLCSATIPLVCGLLVGTRSNDCAGGDCSCLRARRTEGASDMGQLQRVNGQYH